MIGTLRDHPIRVYSPTNLLQKGSAQQLPSSYNWASDARRKRRSLPAAERPLPWRASAWGGRGSERMRLRRAKNWNSYCRERARRGAQWKGWRSGLKITLEEAGDWMGLTNSETQGINGGGPPTRDELKFRHVLETKQIFISTSKNRNFSISICCENFGYIQMRSSTSI